MSIMSIDWEQTAKEFWDEQPHPRGHGLLIKEFATAVKLASMAKFGGHAEPHEAALFYREFQASGLSPEEFEQGLDRLAPLSYVYHGRPPTIKEVVQFKDKSPLEARKHFVDLPDKHHPEIAAGDMVKAFQAARPWARQHLDREPVKTEAAYLHHSGERPEVYYGRLAAQDPNRSDTLAASGAEVEERANPPGRGVAATGGPQTGQ